MHIIVTNHGFKILIGLLLFAFTGCNANSKVNEEDKGKEVVLRLLPDKANPRNSEGDFIKLKNGKLLFAYTKFTGGTGDEAQAHISSRVSDNKGKTWSEKDVTVVPNEGAQNVMSVSFVRLTDGRIALFYLRKNSRSDCIPYMRISDDEAETWGEAVRCIDDPGYYVLNNNRVEQLSTGRLILPVALHSSPGMKWTGDARIFCYFSDDTGKTWNRSIEVPNPDKITLQEPGVIELKDGKLLLYCRTKSGMQYFSYSSDSGKSWSAVVPGNIKSPCSPATIKRIPSTGDLLAVWNNNAKPGKVGRKRTPFNTAISDDDGKTWKNIKTVESDPDGWYCYTAIEFTDSHVLLGHCAGDRKEGSGLATTNITRLSIDWIYGE